MITGCRRGEITGLKWNKIDWEDNQIKIDGTILYSTDIGVYEGTPKTESSNRFIKVPLETMELLREYETWFDAEKEKMGDRWTNSNYVFVQENGSPMHPDSINKWLNKFTEKHGLPHINPHAFRHTHASILYFSGVDSVSISKRLGHSKVSTTGDIYSHLMKEAEEKMSECIADVIFKKRFNKEK